MSMLAAQQVSARPGVQAGVSRRGLTLVARATASKTVKSKGAKSSAMVCVDCGYLYDGKKGAFDDLPNSYSCPVCGAPKKRFRGYLGSRRSNDNKTMSLRRDELREQLEAAGESVGEDVTFLAVTAASAAVFLGAVYYFTSVAR